MLNTLIGNTSDVTAQHLLYHECTSHAAL